jgi:hypothetical protein
LKPAPDTGLSSEQLVADSKLILLLNGMSVLGADGG